MRKYYLQKFYKMYVMLNVKQNKKKKRNYE